MEPATVTVSALKPRGNPLASGRTRALADAAEGDTSPCGCGRPAGGRSRRGCGSAALIAGVSEAWLTDLLEESDGAPLPVEDGAVVVDMPAFGTVTLCRSRGDDPPDPAAPGGTHPPSPPWGGYPPPQAPLARPRAVEPVYARYWLHGKGPAPAGNLPVAVHFSPVRVALAEPGEEAALTLTVGCGAEPAAGTVELVTPAEVTVTPDFRGRTCATTWPAAATRPGTCRCGCRQGPRRDGTSWPRGSATTSAT